MWGSFVISPSFVYRHLTRHSPYRNTTYRALRAYLPAVIPAKSVSLQMTWVSAIRCMQDIEFIRRNVARTEP